MSWELVKPEDTYSTSPGMNQFDDHIRKNVIMTRLEDKDFCLSKVCTIKRAFNAIQFYDLTYSKEESNETSKTNPDESDFVEQLIKQFL